MLTTTLNRIRDHGPCAPGWEKLLSHLGKTKADDEPLGFDVIIKSNGLMDALWCLRAEPSHQKEYRLLAVSYARDVEHLMEDKRSIKCLDVAERFANGQATAEELEKARFAACCAADAAYDAAYDTAFTAGAANAAYAAASAARAADAAYAARAANAAYAAAYAASAKKEFLAKQEQRFVAMIESLGGMNEF